MSYSVGTGMYVDKYLRILHLDEKVNAEVYARIIHMDDFGYILEIEAISDGSDLVLYKEGAEVFVSKNSRFDFIFATPSMMLDAFTRENDLFIEFAKESRGINLTNGNYDRNENFNPIINSMSYEEQIQMRDVYRTKYRKKHNLMKE